MTQLSSEMSKRRTFAIISHPDAGKTTLTEQLLLFGGAIQLAGSVKARKAARHATSDWMAMEKERGISVTSSVMQFDYRDRVVNLLDTPGHADFSEDTYRTLTAVDSALMVIDVAKGVEERTVKLMDVCRLRDTPIFTFINKLDREGKDPMELLDEVESVLKIQCAPVTWPIGMGKRLKGVYHLIRDELILYRSGARGELRQFEVIKGLDSEAARAVLGDDYESFAEEIELVKGASHSFDRQEYLAGTLTPVYFGAAINNFGVTPLLDDFVEYAPAPQPRATSTGVIDPADENFSGFVFKIQANMDPNHRDRMAFLRVCSGTFKAGEKVFHVRADKQVKFSAGHSFMASDRGQVNQAWPGDIVGLHNHGTISIGDTFSAGQKFSFSGIPSFAPELFRRARLRDPMRAKQLVTGLTQLAEEGATQFFRPLNNNDLILGAVGTLQFDVVAYRLQSEYNVECQFEPVNVATARWVYCDDPTELRRFRDRVIDGIAEDASGALVYLAPTRVNLDLTQERWPELTFAATRDLNH